MISDIRSPSGSEHGSFDLLSDIVVLDLTSSVAGPYGTMLLGDLGATIIKVERPEGDDTRKWGPPFLAGESLWFISVNRNKQSICIDGKAERGKQLLQELFDRADVVITNQLKASQEKLGIDAATVRAARPSLIHVSLTGFGLSGPNAELACYDLIAEGYSGVMDLTGAPDSPPQKIGTPAADLLAGGDAALAVAAALYRRSKTGQGADIEVTLTESMIRFLAPRIVPYLGSGKVPTRTGGSDSVIAIYQAFETADLPLTLALGNDAIWRRFWTAVEHPDLADMPGTETNAARRVGRQEIVARIQEVLLTRRRDEWMARFRLAKVPAGPINRVDEVVEDKHFRARGLFFDIKEEGVALPQVGLGIRVDDTISTYRSGPPRLGEHSGTVLVDILGYTSQQVEELRGLSVIKQATAENVNAVEEGTKRV